MGLGREVLDVYFSSVIQCVYLSISLSKLPIGCCSGENVINCTAHDALLIMKLCILTGTILPTMRQLFGGDPVTLLNV